MSHRAIRRSAVFVFIAVLATFYSNCDLSQRNTFTSSSSPSMAAGGTGLDGKVYATYGECKDGHLDRLIAIQVSDDQKNVQILRQDCLDLATPVAIEASQLQFAFQDRNVFRRNGRIFDLQVRSGQRVTIEFNQSTGPGQKVQSLVWQTIGVAGKFFGSVTSENGPGTGILNVPPPLNSLPVVYRAVSTPSGFFDLTLTNSTSAVLNYTLGAGAATTAQMDRTFQTSPVRPQTVLHYASGNDIISNSGAMGFNLADVSSVAELNALPAGTMGLVWLGLCNGVDANFVNRVTPFQGHPRLWGFNLMSDPDPTGTIRPLCPASNLLAEANWIRANLPGARTYVTLMAFNSESNPSYLNTYNPGNTNIDYFGLSPYPCTTSVGGCDYGRILRAVQAAQDAGIPVSAIIPNYQAAGGFGDDTGGTYTMPTPPQLNLILATWGSVIPSPAFDRAWAWRTGGGVTTLEAAPELQVIFSEQFAP